MKRSPEGCRFKEEGPLSMPGRLCGEWCMGSVLKDARDFLGREIEGRHLMKRVFMHLSALVPQGNTQMCTGTACGCGNSSPPVLSVDWFLLGEHLCPP